MAQRNSGYDRVPNDTYVTPDWVWECLFRVEPWAAQATDPCPPDFDVDFLETWEDRTYIATNPPFTIAEKILRHALSRTWLNSGAVAMLLPHEWDCAKSRRYLFDGGHPFKCKYTLTERIRWANLPQKKAGPSSNHAWFVFDWKRTGPPLLRYLP